MRFQVDRAAHRILVLVKGDRQMGSQVDQTTNIILTLEEKWEEPYHYKILKKKKREREEKVQTLPSGRTFFLGSG